MKKTLTTLTYKDLVTGHAFWFRFRFRSSRSPRDWRAVPPRRRTSHQLRSVGILDMRKRAALMLRHRAALHSRNWCVFPPQSETRVLGRRLEGTTTLRKRSIISSNSGDILVLRQRFPLAPWRAARISVMNDSIYIVGIC